MSSIPARTGNAPSVREPPHGLPALSSARPLSVARGTPVTGSIARCVRSISIRQARRAGERCRPGCARLDTCARRRSIRPDSTGPELLELFRDAIPETGTRRGRVRPRGAARALTRAKRSLLRIRHGLGRTGRRARRPPRGRAEPERYVWRSGPAATTIERALVECARLRARLRRILRELLRRRLLREPHGTGDGARIQVPGERGRRPAGDRLRLSEIHMSIPKAVALLGLGRENLRSSPSTSASG